MSITQQLNKALINGCISRSDPLEVDADLVILSTSEAPILLMIAMKNLLLKDGSVAVSGIGGVIDKLKVDNGIKPSTFISITIT